MERKTNRKRDKDNDGKEKRKAKQKAKGEVCKERKKLGKKKGIRTKKQRENLVYPYSVLFRSTITLQVSSCDLGGSDISASPW